MRVHASDRNTAGGWIVPACMGGTTRDAATAPVRIDAISDSRH